MRVSSPTVGNFETRRFIRKMEETYCEPSVLWRLRKAPNSTARAIVVPTWHNATLIGVGERKYPRRARIRALTDAIAGADDVRLELLARGLGRRRVMRSASGYPRCGRVAARR